MHPNELTLNDYVDGGLEPAERATLERHLTTCLECRQLVDDLREIGRRAAALPRRTPPAGAWTRIEQEIHGSARFQPSGRLQPSGRYVRLSWLAAAAVVVVAALVGGRFVLTSRQQAARATAAAGAENGDLAQSIESELAQAEQHYQKAFVGLEQIANSEKGALDPQTAATFQKSLAVIDQAIAESRAALKTQPNSEPAQQSLLDSFKTKVSLLQDTVALINEMRKGNDAGAARIVSGLKSKS